MLLDIVARLLRSPDPKPVAPATTIEVGGIAIELVRKRIRNIHLKEFTKKGTDSSLESFRPLLDGTTNWPAVLQALEANHYDRYLTFEYFHPYEHFPEALVYQTGDSLDRMLGRK